MAGKIETKKDIIWSFGINPKSLYTDPIISSQPPVEWYPTQNSIKKRIEKALIVSLKLYRNSWTQELRIMSS